MSEAHVGPKNLPRNRHGSPPQPENSGPAQGSGTGSKTSLSFRHELRADDREVVRAIVASTGFFHAPEVEVAVELVDERLAKGPASGYHFVFAEEDGVPLGYACYGPIACTAASYDLFWIAVEQSKRGQGLGRVLLEQAEKQIRAMGGHRVYIETSNRDLYLPTRRFYERCDYALEAVLQDFYGPGDGKAIFVKALRDCAPTAPGTPAGLTLPPPATIMAPPR